jgi:hypothetical protein
MSFVVAIPDPLIICVLLVTLKTRLASLPKIVKVLFFWSTPDTIPWNGSGRGFGLAGDTVGEEDAPWIGEAEAERPLFLGMV